MINIKHIKKIIQIVFFFVLFVALFAEATQAARIKELSQVQGVRENMLLGYGLVVGLNGTGDKAGADFTLQSISNMLERQGVAVNKDDLTVKNVAAVMVTAKLPPFARKGNTIDVLISTIGDAKSLQGGTLLMTPVLGPDGKTYAVAQGPLSVGGFEAAGQGAGVQKNHPTVGRIVDGAIIEREIPFSIQDKRGFTLILKSPDFTTASRLARAVNAGANMNGLAVARDAGTVDVTLSERFKGNMVELIAAVENLEVTPDRTAKIVLDERTGTVVLGENISISTVAVAHGSLSIQISETPLVSQPDAFSGGDTVTATDTQIAVTEKENKLIMLQPGVKLGDIVNALNAIGVTPRDLIAVLQAIKAAGALQAELEVI